jgi:hypothetical protein
MTPPLVVSLPHRSGRTEATRRLKDGLASVSSRFGAFFVIEEEICTLHGFDFQRARRLPPDQQKDRQTPAPEAGRRRNRRHGRGL